MGVEAKVEHLASHIYGCRVIQRLFEHCTEEQLRDVLEQLLSCIPQLAWDAYGNLVVRQLLEHGSVPVQKCIIRTMQRDLLNFAKSRSSSLVLEKCLVVSNHATELEPERNVLMATILGAPGMPNPLLEQIASDRF